MAETIQKACRGGIAKWHWDSVMEDLKTQGGLDGVIVDRLSVNAHGCGGVTKAGTKFFITWVPNMFLLVSMTQEEKELIDAFAKVVEYRPFCSYISKESGLLTFEWDKKDPEDRFMELRKAGEVNLQRVQ